MYYNYSAATQTDRQTNKQTDRRTDVQTDRSQYSKIRVTYISIFTFSENIHCRTWAWRMQTGRQDLDQLL